MVICRGDQFLQYLGYKKEGLLKNYLYFENKIININDQNKYGESLIFVASYFCEFEMVMHLLSMGADPNIPNNEGNTSLHAAAYFDNLKLLQILVESGGDLRLVNNDGLRPCQMIKNSKNAQKIKSFEQTLFNSFKSQLSFKNNPISIPQRKNSILNNLTKINRNYQQKPIVPYYAFQSGFGNYFCLSKTIRGIVSSTIVIVNSKALTNDTKSKLQNFPCGFYTKIVNKFWNNCPVSVKIISLLDGKENISDRRSNILKNQFIKEVNISGTLRHPNLLLLMCANLILDETACTVQNQLVFERCEEGTMYHYLHTQKNEIGYSSFMDIFNQMTEALLFIHARGIVHCTISSHSLYMINSRTAKLGNFENAMEMSNFEDKKSHFSSLQWNSYNFHNNLDNTFKWLAPEVLNDSFVVNAAIDLYGLAIITWEGFTGMLPHQNRTYKTLIQRYFPPFSIEFSYRIPEQLVPLLQQAFKQDPYQRPYLTTFHLTSLDINGEKEELQNLANPEKKSFNSKDEPNPFVEQVKKSSDIQSKDPVCSRGKFSKNIAATDTDDPVYETISSIKKGIKKSNSLNCLNENDSKKTMVSELYKPITTNKEDNQFLYRDLAALPNPQLSESNWRYPSPQTEIVFEGRGNLSNSMHRDSITRGMKPASHQTSLSTSQTNICTLTGTTDLIKTSSRSSLQKHTSSSSLNKTLVDNKLKPFSYYKRYNLEPCVKLGASPSNISNLIQKYENSEFHPYSSSNSSTPKAQITRSLSSYNSPSKFNLTKSNSSKDSTKGSALSPTSSSTFSSKKNSYFHSLVKKDPADWSSTTEEDDFQSKGVFKRIERFQKPKLFGDLTNNFNHNHQ